jgi:flagellar export protein FliJ
MKKFQFRLERLQKLRERAREQKRLALAEAVQYRQRVERQIDELAAVRAQEKERLRETLAAGAVSIEAVVRSQTFDGLLGRFSQQLGRQLQQVDGVVAQRRTQYEEAAKSLRILERLEARLRGRHESSAERSERELMDELAAAADQRRRLGLTHEL